MPWFPDAVEGALIAGGVSLVGLLISNQSKVSEFRQEWINALREDIALYISHAGRPGGEIAKLNETSSRIQLRLNPDEPESKAVFDAMHGVRRASVESTSEFVAVGTAASDLVKATQVVLKEWLRVKTGEPFYRWTFRSVVAGLLLLVLVFLYQKHQWMLHYLPVSK